MRIEGFDFPQPFVEAARNWYRWDELTREQVRPQVVKALMAIELRTDVESDEEPEDEADEVVVAAFKKLGSTTIFGANRTLLQWEGDTFRINEKPSFAVPESLDAVYSDGDLYFDSYRNASGFLDLTGHFAEASDPDIDDLLRKSPLIYEGDKPIYRVANQTCRRLISMLNKDENLATRPVQTIKQQADDLGFPLTARGEGDDAEILMPEKPKDLKELLEFLLQYWYPGIFDGILRRSNSAQIAPRRRPGG